MILLSYQKTREKFRGYLQSGAFAAKSIRSLLVVFDQYLKWVEKERLEIEQVSYNDLLGFMKHCRHRGISQRTVQHYMITVRHFYDYLLGEGAIVANPAADIRVQGVKRKTLYHILEPHELHALYDRYSDKTLKDRRNKVMLGLLVYQGLRTEELARLEVKEINLREGKVDVPGGRKVNGRLMQLEPCQVMDMYDYTLQVRPELMEIKPKRKTQSKTETELLFIGEGGHRYSFSNFMTQLMIKLRKLNPQVLNARQIRASVITKWVKQYNLRQVQYLAGHRYISSTEAYLQNEMEGLKEEVQQYHPLG